MGGLHAERMEKQLEESEAGRAFLMETQQAKVCGIDGIGCDGVLWFESIQLYDLRD